MSNEHPDMSGNIHDSPFTCHKCNCDIREDRVYGSDAYPDLNFCGLQCLSEWQDGELLRLGQYIESLQLQVSLCEECRHEQ